MQILKDEIKEAILTAATAEFLAQGFPNASMRKIAKQARVCVSNIYNYYPNKEELFYALTEPVSRYLREFINQLEQTACPTKDPEMTEKIGHTLLDLSVNHSQSLQLLLDKSQGTRLAGFKEELIKLLAGQFKAKLSQINPTADSELVLDVVARNYVEGFLEILRRSRTAEQTGEAVGQFIKYHLGGFTQAFG